MAEKTLIANAVEVNCLAHTHYRRAGMAFNHGQNTLQPNSITSSQLAQLKADPRLNVTVADESKGTPTPDTLYEGNLLQSTNSDQQGGEPVDAGDSSPNLED